MSKPARSSPDIETEPGTGRRSRGRSSEGSGREGWSSSGLGAAGGRRGISAGRAGSPGVGDPRGRRAASDTSEPRGDSGPQNFWGHWGERILEGTEE